MSLCQKQSNIAERVHKPEGRCLRLEHDWVLGSIVKVAQSLDVMPEVIWTVGSSGTLNRGLQLAFPEAEVHVIQTGHKLDERQQGRAKLCYHRISSINLSKKVKHHRFQVRLSMMLKHGK